MGCTTQTSHHTCTCRVSKMSIIIEAGAGKDYESGDAWDAITGPITFPGSAKKRAFLEKLLSKGAHDAG